MLAYDNYTGKYFETILIFVLYLSVVLLVLCLFLFHLFNIHTKNSLCFQFSLNKNKALKDARKKLRIVGRESICKAQVRIMIICILCFLKRYLNIGGGHTGHCLAAMLE